LDDVGWKKILVDEIKRFWEESSVSCWEKEPFRGELI